MGTTAREHLDWCIGRAMEYADRGDWVNAWASFASDVGKHDGTSHIGGHPLLGMAMLSGRYDRTALFREFITGWNV
jgi:hypothetical protein